MCCCFFFLFVFTIDNAWGVVVRDQINSFFIKIWPVGWPSGKLHLFTCWLHMGTGEWASINFNRCVLWFEVRLGWAAPIGFCVVLTIVNKGRVDCNSISVCVTDILFWAPWRRRSVWSWPTFLLYSIPAELFIYMAQGYRSNSDHLSPHKYTHRHFMLTHILCVHISCHLTVFFFCFFFFIIISPAWPVESHPHTRREIHTPSGVQWGWAVFF